MVYFKYMYDENYCYDLGNNGTVIKDMAYNDLSSKNKLDLYLPKKKKEKYPVIIYIHGGAFAQGDKTHHIAGILQGLQRGYAIACINYRLCDEAPYPAFLQDVCEGIRYLKAHSDHYHLDKNKFAFWGDTQGGYIASKIAIEGHKGLLDNLETNYSQENLNVVGTVSFYAPIDLSDYYNKQVISGKYYKEENGKVLDEKTFNMKGKELLSFLRTLNPLQNIDGTESPFYLLHGKQDFHIDQNYTKEFDNILNRYNVDHITNFVEEGIHAIDFYEIEKYNEPIMKFFDKVFK